MLGAESEESRHKVGRGAGKEGQMRDMLRAEDYAEMGCDSVDEEGAAITVKLLGVAVF